MSNVRSRANRRRFVAPYAQPRSSSGMPILKTLRGTAPAARSPLLAGCNTVVLNPSGDIAAQQRDLIVISTVLMLLIIVPVIVLTLLFAWRYRAVEHGRDLRRPTGTIRPSSSW